MNHTVQIFLILVVLVIQLIINILFIRNNTNTVNKICEIADKVGIEYQTKTNNFVFTSVKFK